MPLMLLLWSLLPLLLLSGCGGASPSDRPTIQSDPSAYVLQSIVHPLGLEPNYTPYGTPVNAGTSGEYDRWIRPDAVSDYRIDR